LPRPIRAPNIGDMRALYIERHGPHAELRPREVPDPDAGEGEVRVEIEAAGINPSDVGSVEGRFAHAVLPRIVGRDFTGRVVEGPPDLLGQAVWGSGGDLGITRDGTHAEQIVLPRRAVTRRPARLSVEEAAAAGVPFVAAYTALIELGRVHHGQWIIIAGAAGAVGTAATELAASRGALVVALVRDAVEAARVDRNRVAAVARSDRGDLRDVVAAETGGRGADLALNGVGGAIMQPLLDALAEGGRMVVYSAAAGREAPLDLFELYRSRVSLVGLNTAVIDATQGARILAELVPLFESGRVRPVPVIERHPLAAAARGYARVAAGAPGKVVLMTGA